MHFISRKQQGFSNNSGHVFTYREVGNVTVSVMRTCVPEEGKTQPTMLEQVGHSP